MTSNAANLSVQATAVSAVTYDRTAEWLLFAQIIAATFLQTIAIPVAGGIYLGLPIMLGLAGFGVLTGRLELRPGILAAYLIMGAVLAATQFMVPGFSPLSVLLLLIVHASYIFRIKDGSTRPQIELLFFQKCMVVFSIIGVAQYFLQFLIGAKLAFFMQNFVPQEFIIQGFNAMNSLGYKSGTYKSNGVFLLEPSVFCQLLAIALIIEMVFFKNLKRSIIYLGGIAVTFSGTGLIILFLLTPVYLIAHRRFIMLTLGFLVVITAGFWTPLVGLEHTYERAFEFMNPRTSGFARFVSMFYVIGDFLVPDLQSFLFGKGAGSVSQYIMPSRLSYETFDPSWGKVFFEYGFIGLMAYLSFTIILFSQRKRSRYLKAALFIQLFFLGEFVLSPTLPGIIVALLIWPNYKADDVSPEQKEISA